MSSFISEYLQNHKLYKLLYRIANHDPEALEILFHDYGSFIYWHIMNYVQDKSLGEDIFQEVFIKLYLLNPQNVPNRGATSWLIHVIHNTAVTYLENDPIKQKKTCSIPISIKIQKPCPFLLSKMKLFLQSMSMSY